MTDPNVPDSIFFENLRRTVLNGNKVSFHSAINNRIKEKINPQLDLVAQKKGIRRWIDGLHYISYAVGTWYRIILQEPSLDETSLSPLEKDVYGERLQETAPRGINLYTDDDMIRRLHIVFQGDKSKLTDSDLELFDCVATKKEIQLFQALCNKINLVDFALSSDLQFCQWLLKEPSSGRGLNLDCLPCCLLEAHAQTCVIDKNHVKYEDLKHLQDFLDSFVDVLIKGVNGKEPKFSPWRVKQIEEKLIPQKTETLKTHLKEIKSFECYDDASWNKLARRLWAFRLIIFSFFSTLHLRANLDNTDNLFLLIDPFYWPQRKLETDELYMGIRYMAFGAAYQGKKPFSNAELDVINEILKREVRDIVQAELYYGLSNNSGNKIEAEDTIRQCTILSEEVLDEVNYYKHLIDKKWLESTPGEIKNKISDKFVGRNARMVEMIERISQTVAEPDKRDSTQPKLPEGQCVFMHSLPGCGKEGMAELIHLMSCRNISGDGKNLFISSISDSKKLEFIMEYSKAFSYEMDLEAGFLKKHKDDIDNAPDRATKDERLKILRNKLVEIVETKDRLFNYRPQHCGELITGDIFTDVLLGSEEKKKRNWVGLIPIVHGLGGTLFFDEFNTLPTHLSVRFLRVFEKPYQIEMPWDEKRYRMNVNILSIFASNLDAIELIEKGFNPAVVGRITQNIYKIPPLRERKEDIAIFVNHYLQEKKKNNQADGVLKDLTRIHIDALRLICELPWLDNYRGIKGLLDEVILDRKIRHISEPVISFDEVIRALSKRELLTSKSAEDDIKSVFKLTDAGNPK